MISSPTGGSVSFLNANAINTSASFTLDGLYQLAFTASDGELETTSAFFVPVKPQKAINNSPTIRGWDTTAITLPDDVKQYYATVVDLGGLGSSGVSYQ